MDNIAESFDPKDALLRMTAEIVAAYVGHNPVAAEQISEIIKGVHHALGDLAGVAGDGGSRPAVAIKKSINPDFIVCLEDGKKLKMLKRYLRSNYSLTPAQYRTKWSLPPDYPMVAPNYAKQRSMFAKKIGLGRRGRPHKLSRAAI